jgi:DNA invertase Pin-like site-specific DNA recombinase
VTMRSAAKLVFASGRPEPAAPLLLDTMRRTVVSPSSTVVHGGDTDMANGKFVAYYRVSTDGQGQSGLGLEAQQKAVTDYLNGGNWTLVDKFEEIESGRNPDRPRLREALAACRAYRATLVVANVSRLTRSVAFLSKLLESGVEIRFVDLPQIEGPTGRFLLQQMASVAELEAGMIGQRTKAALAAAKARGQKLGGYRGRSLTAEDTARASKARTEKADANAASLLPIVDRLDPDGSLPLRELARRLTAEGVPTSAGSTTWTPAGVARLKARRTATAAR